jgi:hypothetical protein
LRLSRLEFDVSHWNVFEISDVYSTDPGLRLIGTGYGQATTPLSYSNPNRVYGGVYEGDRCYYQCIPQTIPLTYRKYRPPGGDDFYGAGAVYTAAGNESYVVFGGDSGNLYLRPVLRFADQSYGRTFQLGTGPIRSTVVRHVTAQTVPVASDIFFTTKGSPSNDGTLWKFDSLSLSDPSPISSSAIIKNSQSSTSTPVISDNDILYVGSSFTQFGPTPVTIGTVQAFDPSNLSLLAQIYTGDAVQASPIVWTDSEETFNDFIYFTTNSGNGAGYCYSYGGSGTTPTQEWTHANTSGNNYSLQGMASDNGYTVWGDDGNRLYIAK